MSIWDLNYLSLQVKQAGGGGGCGLKGEAWRKMADIYLILQTKTLLTQWASDGYVPPFFRWIPTCVAAMRPTHVFLSHPPTTARRLQTDFERARPDYSRTPSEGFFTDSGCCGDGVSHSHVWDRRSRFTGGARRAQWCSVCHHTDFQ